MAEHNAAAAAPARRDSRLLSMTSPSTSSATALGCARSVTSEHVALHHIICSESDLDSALALRDAQRTVHHPHVADGLPRRGMFRGACLRRIVTFSQTCATWGCDCDCDCDEQTDTGYGAGLAERRPRWSWGLWKGMCACAWCACVLPDHGPIGRSSERSPPAPVAPLTPLLPFLAAAPACGNHPRETIMCL